MTKDIFLSIYDKSYVLPSTEFGEPNLLVRGFPPPNPHKKNEIASIGVRPQCGQPSVNLGAY